ncbi:sodium-dependent bicarbonate transport family permease [Microbulbifer sp. OS29]|uniref:Sodium-dependent bicarbonate transport family permease n=1 Tax=Microbulbifer okhotskensis TaxID=2926617 RepID=A0A9X2EPN1_9GAMM|nr:sodium-dependent bicarbonate transport family permease [Microbulbifer okhotskensis]MCO1335440.1 sodium-dependent bicarbonate transport family permease [Microbulbifer okhotskensis]
MPLDIVVGFFLLGAFAQFVRSDLRLPSGLYQSCTIFLLIAIGLKGGVSLSKYSAATLLPQSLAVLALGALLPLVAFPILRWVGKWSRVDAAATAAHYGSVSVATYAVAVALLQSQDIEYEAYFPLFVALLEVPAIIVGILLARQAMGDVGKCRVFHEVTCNQGVLLLLGGIVIGAWGGERTASVMPFFGTLFHGVLALFLMEMGRVAAARLPDVRGQSAFLLSLGILMPLIGGAAGAALGSLLELSPGGIFLLAVLGSSASYIAVPAAMSAALPQANASVSITLSLAITFPFNVLVAIPVYLALVQHWS